MLLIAVTLFVLAALGGLLMVGGYIARGKRPPLMVAGLHGLLAATGLVLVGFLVVTGSGTDFVRMGFVALVLAALGGFYLLGSHLFRDRVRLPHALAHGLVAVFGVALLLLVLLGYE